MHWVWWLFLAERVMNVNGLRYIHSQRSTDFSKCYTRTLFYLNPQILMRKDLVKANLSNNTRSLYLNNSCIKAIEYDTFKGIKELQNLTFLDISHNNLTHLDGELFNGTTKLKFLDLSYNELTELDHQLFTNLSYLISLSLNNNRLDSLSTANVFKSQKSLLDLNLANNEIAFIDYEAFIGTRELQYLDVSFNVLEYLDHRLFIRNPKLTYLDLSYNNLKDLNSCLFINLSDLRFLNLKNNFLTSLTDENIFKSQQKLLTLNLASNRIRFLHCEIHKPLKELKELNLDNNPLICTCNVSAKIGLTWQRKYACCLGFQSLSCSHHPKNSHNNCSAFTFLNELPGDQEEVSKVTLIVITVGVILTFILVVSIVWCFTKMAARNTGITSTNNNSELSGSEYCYIETMGSAPQNDPIPFNISLERNTPRSYSRSHESIIIPHNLRSQQSVIYDDIYVESLRSASYVEPDRIRNTRF